MVPSELRDLILAQFAAESYLSNVNGLYTLARALKDGNNNFAHPYFGALASDRFPGNTRMTDEQIARFDDVYEVVHHQPNTWTGFSGTLVRNTETNQYVLSFRSTEWANESQGGDWGRDGVADSEIGTLGFAVAQIADAEAYFQKLRTEGLLPSDAMYRVTGYSLGGHLATVFAEAHADDSRLQQVVTFNGPGRGRLASGKAVKDLVEKAYSSFSANNALLKSGDAGSIYATRFYAGDDTSPGLRAEVLAGFGAAGASLFNSPTADLANGKITQVVGMADFDDLTLVANSGVHSSNYLNVFIEDQPNIQGLALVPSWVDTIAGMRSDFGTTHSITLIADAVETGTLLQTIDGTLSQEAINAVLSTGSNARGITKLFSNGLAESDSLEHIVEALAVVYGADIRPFSDEGTIRHGVRGGEFGILGNRNSFFDATKAVLERIAPGSTGTIRSFIGFSAESLAALAKDDGDAGLSYRYALVAGNGFVVQASRALYDDSLKGLNAGGRLDRLGSVTHPGLLSDRYLEDRAAFVERKTYFNLNNARYDLTVASTNPGTKGDPIATAYDGENVVWTDIASGASIRRTTSSALTQYRLFGSDGGDVLRGGLASDSLYGSAGPDTLDGGRASDYLEGGSGLDTYSFAAGDGADVVLDTDGLGLLVRDGLAIFMGVKVQGADVWTFGETQYARIASSLVVSFPGGSNDSITIEDFDFDAAAEGGYLGIRLLDYGATSQGERAPVNVFEGDRRALGSFLDDQGRWVAPDPYSFDAFGNFVRDSSLTLEGEDDEFVGSPNDDVVYGRGNNDFLHGEDGDDALYGGTGDDLLFGGDGDDVLYGDRESEDEDWNEVEPRLASGFVTLDDGLVMNLDTGEIIDGPPPLEGAGNDRIFGDGGNDLIHGQGGADELYGGDGNDVIAGGGSAIGQDELYGGEGDDRLFAGDVQTLEDALDAVVPVPGGGPGAMLSGEGGDDILVGADQADTLMGGDGIDLLLGGDGDDALYGDAGDDYLAGGGGADELNAGDGSDVLVGGDGDDVLTGGDGADVIQAGEGDDVIRVKEADVVWAGSGNDNVEWEEAEALSSWTIFLESGDDSAEGSDGDDYIDGGDGSDFVYGNGGNDMLLGGDGDDVLEGGSGNNTLLGGNGNDMLSAEDGDDVIFGDAGDDFIVAGAGNDRLTGGAGTDVIDGGMGDDVMAFNPGDGMDTILDTGVGGSDTVLFGDGISPGDVSVVVDSDSTVLSLTGTEDRVVLLYGAGGASGIEHIAFLDGTVWEVSALYTGYTSVRLEEPSESSGTPPGDVSTSGSGIGTESPGASGPHVLPANPDDLAEVGHEATIATSFSIPQPVEEGLGGDYLSVPAAIGRSSEEPVRFDDSVVSREEEGVTEPGTNPDEPGDLATWYSSQEGVANLPFVHDFVDEAPSAKSSDSRTTPAAEVAGLTSWDITNALLQYHLELADDARLGGELTNPFGRNDLSRGMSITSAQQLIGAAGFGAEAQTLQLFTGLQEGLATLS